MDAKKFSIGGETYATCRGRYQFALKDHLTTFNKGSLIASFDEEVGMTDQGTTQSYSFKTGGIETDQLDFRLDSMS